MNHVNNNKQIYISTK